MSDTEKLMAEAIFCVEHGIPYEEFASSKKNRKMADAVKAPLVTIWQAAIYAATTYRQSITCEVNFSK